MSKGPPSPSIEMRQEHADDLALIDGYGDGGFRVKGRRFEGGIIITGAGVWPLDLGDDGDMTPDCISRLVAGDSLDLVLIGRGAALTPLPKAVRLAFKDAGLAYDIMGTGAAARTYNLLMVEGRRVAGVLLSV